MLIEGVDLVKRYEANGSRNAVSVLDGVRLGVQRGERVAIMGSSGSGKSTLLHILGGLDRPTSGDVRFDGESIMTYDSETLARYRNRRIGFIFQFHHLLPEFTAWENVLMPTLISDGDTSDVEFRAGFLFEHLQIAHRRHHRPSECSGGEQQRIAIARALINRPDLILADEPTGNLDQANASIVLDLLLSLQESEGVTMILVTHDPAIAARCNRELFLTRGRILESQPN